MYGPLVIYTFLQQTPFLQTRYQKLLDFVIQQKVQKAQVDPGIDPTKTRVGFTAWLCVLRLRCGVCVCVWAIWPKIKIVITIYIPVCETAIEWTTFWHREVYCIRWFFSLPYLYHISPRTYHMIRVSILHPNVHDNTDGRPCRRYPEWWSQR